MIFFSSFLIVHQCPPLYLYAVVERKKSLHVSCRRICERNKANLTLLTEYPVPLPCPRHLALAPLLLVSLVPSYNACVHAWLFFLFFFFFDIMSYPACHVPLFPLSPFRVTLNAFES